MNILMETMLLAYHFAASSEERHEILMTTAADALRGVAECLKWDARPALEDNTVLLRRLIEVTAMTKVRQAHRAKPVIAVQDFFLDSHVYSVI